MLKDVFSENMDVVFCGTAKGKKSASSGYYYAGPGNKFYNVLHRVGFTPYKLSPTECYTICKFKIGLTDLVHTECGNDNEINDESYEVDSFILKMINLNPKFIAFTSKRAASFALGFHGNTEVITYGLQQVLIGKSKVFVLPSTSGNARRYWDETYWFELNNLIKN